MHKLVNNKNTVSNITSLLKIDINNIRNTEDWESSKEFNPDEEW